MESLEHLLPSPPAFSAEFVRECQDADHFEPILFEWDKFVGQLVAVVAHIQSESPAFLKIPKTHYHVLIGLLHRCARLMLSNVVLSHDGKFAETTAIVDRCIFESAVKIIWMVDRDCDDRINRYFADGLNTEIELRKNIEDNIKTRGYQQIIKRRMIASIDRTIQSANMTEEAVVASKRLPDLAAMIQAVGLNRLLYIVGQKVGSHHVHGTWPCLLSYYLETRDETSDMQFAPRSSHRSTDCNQYMFVCGMTLAALSSYVRYVLDRDDAKVLSDLFSSVEAEIYKVFMMAVGSDADPVPPSSPGII